VTRYGDLYEKAAHIRRQLQALLPGQLTGNYTSADARRFAREMKPLVEQVDALADEWDRLERKMRDTDD
jgi:hypothetical protein